MNRQSKTVERTVVPVSLPLTRSRLEALNYIYQVYGRILAETLEYMWKSNIPSVVFTKEVGPKGKTGSIKVYGIDVNENNVTIYAYPDNKAITIVTDFSKVVLGYAYRRARIQQKWSQQYGVKVNRRLRVALRKFREKNVKKNAKLRLAKIIIDIIKDDIAVLENLPKKFQDKAIERSNHLNELDVHRLKQPNIQGIQKLIIERLERHNMPYVMVNPRGTSSTCPFCDSKLVPMTGYVQRNWWKPRMMKCSRYGSVEDRNIIGAMNIAKRYLLDVRHVPFVPKGAHDSHVVCNYDEAWAKAQPVLVRPIMT